MSEQKTERDDILTPHQRATVSIVHDARKRKLSTHIMKAVAWVGSGIICFGLGLFTMRAFYFIVGTVVFLVFTAIHVAVHWDFMNQMDRILKAFEEREK